MAIAGAMAVLKAKLRRSTRRWAALALAGALALFGFGLIFVGALIGLSALIGPALAFAGFGAGLLVLAMLFIWARSLPHLARLQGKASATARPAPAQAGQNPAPAPDLNPDLQMALLLGFAAACAVIDAAKDRKSGRA